MPVDKIVFRRIGDEVVMMILDKRPTLVWTHACHQKIASGCKKSDKNAKANTAKVWFGRVPVDKIVLSMLRMIKKNTHVPNANPHKLVEKKCPPAKIQF